MTAVRRRLGGLAWILGAALASALSIAFLDRPAATWSHEIIAGKAVFVALTHIVDPLVPAAALCFLVVGVARLSGWRPGPVSSGLFTAAVAVLVSVVVKDQLKFAFGRLWPETWVNNNPSWIKDAAFGFFPFHGGTGWSSFPSGHMSVTTAPMAAAWRLLPRWRVLSASLVFLMAVGLYGADYHFIGDIIAGTLVGSLCAAIVICFVHPEAEPTALESPRMDWAAGLGEGPRRQ